MMQILTISLFIFACINFQLANGLVQNRTLIQVTGDTAAGMEFLPPYLNTKGECDTTDSTKAHYLTVSFTTIEEAVHLVEALFAPGWVETARVFVYNGGFEPTNPCNHVNLSLTLDASLSFRIAVLLPKGDYTFVVTGVAKGAGKKAGEGPFALHVEVADFSAPANPARPTYWEPPILQRNYNCSDVGNATAYLAHTYTAQQSGAHDVSVWLSGQPSPKARSVVFVFDGIIEHTSPDACQSGIEFHDAGRADGHFNEFTTIFLKNKNYTIVTAWYWEAGAKPTELLGYGLLITAPSNRVNTNTSFAPWNVPADQGAQPENCTASGVTNKYNYVHFTAKDALYFFDFIDTFDGNHTLLSVYEGSVGGSLTTPPSTCDNWLGTTRDNALLPVRHHSLWLRLNVGQNYTVIVASQQPGIVGIFRPAIFSGVSIDPRPPPTTTGTTSTATATTATSTATTGNNPATTTATSSTTGTTGRHRRHHNLAGWQVALIVVGVLGGTGIIVGAIAYYMLVVRRRPQYELIN